jgi:hypothetical protein
MMVVRPLGLALLASLMTLAGGCSRPAAKENPVSNPSSTSSSSSSSPAGTGSAPSVAAAPTPDSGAAAAPAGADCSVTVEADPATADGVRVTAIVRNRGSAPLYLLDGERMPYQRVEGDRLVVGWSIQPVPDDLDVGAIAPLATVELAAGAELRREARVGLPLQVSSHLRSPSAHAGALPPTLALIVEIGVIDAPLDPAQRHRQSYPRLVAAQRTCQSAPVAVTLPRP